MSLYPSLEDMHVHKIVQAQQNAFTGQMNTEPIQNAYPGLGSSAAAASAIDKPNPSAPILYPGLGDFMGLRDDFMGLELTNEMIALNTQNPGASNAANSMIAPLSNQTVGLKRAQVTHGIREVTVCKSADNKIGLRVKDINNGIFITLVCKDSPAAMVG